MSELEFWKDLGNIFDAVLNYQKKNVEFNNRFINPWIRLGNIFDRQDQTNDAVQAYQRAAEIDPETAQSWVDLGDAQFKNGGYDEAIEAYRKAVTIDPEAGWPLGNLALSLVTQGRIEEAIPLYQKSIDLLIEVKDKAICWNRLGNAYRKINDYENAFHAFQKADQLDGENTGFNDKLDETLPNTSVVAPEEILDQMIVEQTADEEAQPTAPETVDEAAQEIPQPEIESAITTVPNLEIINDPVALAPNMEMIVDENVEVEPTLSLNAVNAEEPVDEESPLALHEKSFDILQVVEDVIAKVEQAYIEQEISDLEAVQVVEEVVAESESSITSEESAQEVEAIAEINEEVETPVMSELSEETVQEIESSTQADDAVVLEVETAPTPDETIQIAEVETSTVNEEVVAEVEVITLSAEILKEAGLDLESPVVEEPRRAPTWLTIKDLFKTKETVAETEVQAEFAQSESAITLSNISQVTAVSESAVNMGSVETYTDPLAVQLTTEPSLSEETLTEATDQPTEQVEAELQAQEMIAAGESSVVVESTVSEEISALVEEERTAELAYEEYLKDMTEPAKILTDHVDDIHGETPITKVSKNGEVRIAMDTKNAHVWNELGNIYLNASACDDAIASYSKAIELDRDFAWPYSNLALAYVQKGRFAEAILLYQRGIELFTTDKDKAITWNRLGNVYRRINDYNNAIAAYQTADELDPENATLSLRSSFGLLGNMYSDSKPALVA